MVALVGYSGFVGSNLYSRARNRIKGVKAIAQPGGSVRDADSIKKADECGIVMLFTGERHFKH